jgi:hypothetical protein
MRDVTRLESRAKPVNGELLDHGQAALVGATLRWKRYRGWNSPTPRSRCELCAAGFTEGGSPGLNSGYSVVGGGPAGQDDYRWICAVCYETRRNHFCWTVLDTNNAPIEPSGLLEAAFEWIAWRIEEAAD